MQSRLDDEQNLVGKMNRNVKELQGRIQELEEELEAERQSRSKVDCSEIYFTIPRKGLSHIFVHHSTDS